MRPDKTTAAADQRALRFTGFLGHTFAVVRDGETCSRVSAECTSIESARRLADRPARIYRRQKKRWVFVENVE